jgi:16S rRNA (cytidine1402-2'-O)-methyltransferase
VVDGKKEDGNLKWSEEQLQKAIENEMKNEKSAKEISIELAKRSGWHKKDVYRLINQKH